MTVRPATTIRRAATAAGLVAALAATSTACQAPATMWGACSPNGSDATGHDGTYLLACVNGTWEPVMTLAEFARMARGEQFTIAPLPTRPTTTTTSTTSTTVPPLGTLDQATGGSLNSAIGIGLCSSGDAPIALAQTFTAGISGPLVGVSVFAMRSAGTTPIDVSIRSTSGGDPTSTVLGTATVTRSGAAGYAWIDIPLDAPVTVASGTEYAIVLEADEGCSGSARWSISMSSENPYADGHALTSTFADPTLVAGPYDVAVKTWMGPVG